MSATFSSANSTAPVNSYPGIGFAQEATGVATDDAPDVKTDTAAAVATEKEEEEETTAAEVANIAKGKLGATKATVGATVSLLPEATAHITVSAHCDTNTVIETHFGQLPSSDLPRDNSNTVRVHCIFSWKQLLRVTAFVLRAIRIFKNWDQPDTTPRSNPPSPFRSLSLLSSNEMSASKIVLLRSSQHDCFVNKIKPSFNHKRISSKRHLRRLKHFLHLTQTHRLLSKTSYDTEWTATHSSSFHHLYSQQH